MKTLNYCRLIPALTLAIGAIYPNVSLAQSASLPRATSSRDLSEKNFEKFRALLDCAVASEVHVSDFKSQKQLEARDRGNAKIKDFYKAAWQILKIESNSVEFFNEVVDIHRHFNFDINGLDVRSLGLAYLFWGTLHYRIEMWNRNMNAQEGFFGGSNSHDVNKWAYEQIDKKPNKNLTEQYRYYYSLWVNNANQYNRQRYIEKNCDLLL